ncbi:IS982 family transposase, partial [Magnetococcales bacterium HHB-1]
MRDNRPKEFVKKLMSVRRLIETVIGQLTERFNIEKIRVRDVWHLKSRIARKILSHTICVFMNRQLGRDPLVFDGLVSS